MDLGRVNALVAENVMGWRLERIGREHQCEYWYPEGVDASLPPLTNGAVPVECWNPATNIMSAWKVMEKLSHLDPIMNQYGEDDGSWSWAVDFEGTNVDDPLRSKSAPLAICLAALRAVGIEVPE